MTGKLAAERRSSKLDDIDKSSHTFTPGSDHPADLPEDGKLTECATVR